MKRTVLPILLFSASALAGHHSPVSAALDDVKEARELIEDRGGACSRKVSARLDDATDALKALREEEGSRKEALTALDRADDTAEEHCGHRTAAQLTRLLERAASRLKHDDDDGDRPRRHDDDRDREGVREDGMEASAYQSFLAALRSNPNEILRKDAAITTLSRNRVNARQLGSVLDQFPNEVIRMDVARAAAPNVVDRPNAVGLSVKFRNSIFQGEFVRLMNP